MPGLEKLRVVAYSDAKMEQEAAAGTFVVQLNPEGYSLYYKIEHDDKQAPGTSGTNLKFTKVLPEELDLEFLFDATGAIPPDLAPAYSKAFPVADGVSGALAKFRSVLLDYHGDSHRPRHLKLTWGRLLFKGVLTEMQVSYKLFRPDGTPIRAVAKAKFKGSVEDELRLATEGPQSPNVTHVRTILPGESLAYMCHRIYGDSRRYVQVAAFNGLDDIRDLPAGEMLRFPPIEA